MSVEVTGLPILAGLSFSNLLEEKTMLLTMESKTAAQHKLETMIEKGRG